MKQFLPIIILIIISIVIVFSAGLRNKGKVEVQPSISDSKKVSEPEATRASDLAYESLMEATKSTQLVSIVTQKGTVEIELDEKSAPKFVENFINKIKSGFYDNLTFHRVEDWVVQGGDPKGDGTGGGNIETELSNKRFLRGSMGVARGPDIRISNDSQFFILTKNSEFLNGQYTYFGRVVGGMDVVDSIEVGERILDTQYSP